MRADFFVHPNYLALEATRHSARSRRKPYRNMQQALIDAYSNAAIRSLAYNPPHGSGWNLQNRDPEDLIIRTQERGGKIPRKGRDKIKMMVEDRGVTEAVLHGLYVFRCLDHFAESLEEATEELRSISYGIVGARKDDISLRHMRSTRSACAGNNRDEVVNGLVEGCKYLIEDEEKVRFTDETRVFVV